MIKEQDQTTQQNCDAATLLDNLELIKSISDDFESYAASKSGALDQIYDAACAALSSAKQLLRALD